VLKSLSLARGGCLGGDTRLEGDDRGHPFVSVSTETTSIYLPVGKVRRGCPGVLSTKNLSAHDDCFTVLYHARLSTSSVELPPNIHMQPIRVITLPRIRLPKLKFLSLVEMSPLASTSSTLSMGIVSIIGPTVRWAPRAVHTVYEYRYTSLANVVVQ